MGLEDIDGMRVCAALLPPPGDAVVTECLAEIAALRAQLAAAEEENTRLNGFLHECHRGMEIQTETLDAALKGRWDEATIAAARADAAREFAEWLDETGHDIESSGVHDRKIFENADAALKFYLSSLGVPRARPDDAERIKRAAQVIADRIGFSPDNVYDVARDALAAADGAERGGR
jgi:hypothetical protein